MSNPRELAICMLIKIQEGSYGNLLLNQHLTSDMSLKDRALVTELVNGVIQNLLRIDYIISQFSKIDLSKISPFVKNAIRVGIYQTFFLDRVPDFAAVNESVSLVKKYEGKRAANFTNAILRNVLRKRDDIVYPNKNTNIEKYLSIYYSFPSWLIQRWIELFDKNFTEDLCMVLNERPKPCIRVNTLVTDREELEKQLSAEGARVAPGLFTEEALYILDSPPIAQLESFNKGLFAFQDESSIIASLAAGVKSDDKVLDVAAAPGGKAAHMAAIMQNQGEIIAWDIHPHRVKLIEQNCNRLKAAIVVPEVRNAKIPDKNMFNKFDKVIIDAPCSGLGVIRRKPDIKWSKRPEDITALKSEQKEILEVCSKYVKPEGFLIYSTCSIEPEENEKNVDEFLAKNDSFIYDDLRPYLPEKLHDSLKQSYGYITLYPNIHGTDGFFIARLKRIKA